MKPHVRISFTRPDTLPGNLTVSQNHLIMTLNSAAVGATADNLETCEYQRCKHTVRKLTAKPGASICPSAFSASDCSMSCMQSAKYMHAC